MDKGCESMLIVVFSVMPAAVFPSCVVVYSHIVIAIKSGFVFNTKQNKTNNTFKSSMLLTHALLL